MSFDVRQAYDAVYAWAAAEGFAGYDPFDGLESRIFQATPLKHISIARLAWLQMVKRAAVDLRDTLRVPKGINSKGIALFALAELSRFRDTLDEGHKRNGLEHLETLRDPARTICGNVPRDAEPEHPGA